MHDIIIQYNNIIQNILDNDTVSEYSIESIFQYLSKNVSADLRKGIKQCMPFFIFPRNFLINFGNASIYHEETHNSEILLLQIIINKTMYRIDFKDPIASEYIKVKLDEMAHYVQHEVNPLHNIPEYQTTLFYTEKNNPIKHKFNQDEHELHVHMNEGSNSTTYTSLDHKKKKAFHLAHFVKHNANDRLPFEHETQEAVERIHHPAMWKGYSGDLTYLHFIGSKYPLSSSDKQQIGGNKMWKHLSHRAFDDGHHVYLWDNLKNQLHHLDSKDKIDSGLNHYFSSTEPRTTDFGHIVISKEKL